MGEPLLVFEGPSLPFSVAASLGDGECYVLQVGPGTYIDPAPPARFVNHSCQPNAGIVGGTVLSAIQDISQGQEITFDYSTTMDEDYWSMRCGCGSAVCRGVVADFKTLPFALRERYLRLGIVQPFIADRWGMASRVLPPSLQAK